MVCELVVIGASLGGFRALSEILGGLERSFPLPLAVVQHRCEDSESDLRRLLQRGSSLPVFEAEDKQAILRGRAYLAPPGYHLLVEGDHFALSTEPPVNFARPSIDVLFESAADSYGERLMAILLTGSSSDGAIGMRRVKLSGGLTLVQDPDTAEGPFMPRAAIRASAVDRVLPLSKIPEFLSAFAQSR